MPETNVELMFLEQGDWRVRYATGAAGITMWNLDDPLDLFVRDVNAVAKTTVGRRGNGRVLFCNLRLSVDQKGTFWNSYKLESRGEIINTTVSKEKMVDFLKVIVPKMTVLQMSAILRLPASRDQQFADLSDDIFQRIAPLCQQSVLIAKIATVASLGKTSQVVTGAWKKIEL